MSLHILKVFAKKSHDSSSDESIENLLYYKDCQRDKKEKPSTPLYERLEVPPRRTAMDCPFPKMCCSLTCGGNECGTSSPFFGPQIETMDRMKLNHPPIMPLSGPTQPLQQSMPRGRKKKVKQPMSLQMQPPIGSRRSYGFTKDRIKSLINEDDDIRKILKDLVRVTMQKADLVDMINTNRGSVSKPPLQTRDSPNHNTEDEEDEDLE